MAEISVFHETRETLLQKARLAMQMAEKETLPNRARIHVAAAETWLRLAARKKRNSSLAASSVEIGPALRNQICS